MNVPTPAILTAGPATPAELDDVPEISWPSTAGGGKATSPLITWRSVWQTPQAATLTRISPRLRPRTGISLDLERHPRGRKHRRQHRLRHLPGSLHLLGCLAGFC